MLDPPVRKILLVEDDEQGVMPAELFFDEETWEPEGTSPPKLLIARNEDEFRDMVERHGESIEAVITDIALSDDPTNPNVKTGIDLYTELRVHLPEAPCFAITGQAPDSEAIKAVKSGVVDYIKKPFSWNGLWERIQKSIAVARLNRSRRIFQDTVAALIGHLKTLHALSTPTLSRQLLNKIVEIAVLTTEADGGCLFMANPDGELECQAVVGYPEPQATETALYHDVYRSRMEQCFFLTGEEDTSSLSDFEKEQSALISVPLIGDAECLGVLEIARMKGGDPFEPRHVSLMNQFATMGGVTVEAHRRDIGSSEILVRALRHALERQQALVAEEPLEAIVEHAVGLERQKDKVLESITASLASLKARDPESLEFWAETLERFVAKRPS